MLTGRLDRIFTVRQDDGLSGFAKIDESEHDTFGAGHASTALSAALGVAQARNIKKENYNVVAVIGDASLSGGMAFEALNNVQHLKDTNFICILNDNNMSISKPVGNMANYMTSIRTSPPYTSAKDKFERIFSKIPDKIGVPLKRRIEKTVERLRDIMLDVKVGVIFEEFGFKYLGPIDGHNTPLLMGALKFAKNYPGPVMIHILTVKGKGHTPAENNPIKYHGVSPQKSQPTVPSIKPSSPSYSAFFGNEVCQLAKQDKDIVVVTPAMTEGSGLNRFADEFPDRFFDVGIAEEHAVTFAAGLARAGSKPILSIYSTFLQRGYDQVVHDVCLQNLPVIFTLDRSGIVGADGPTHHGVFDIAYLIHIPNMIICAPKNGAELSGMLKWAITENLPISIRFPRGSIPEQEIVPVSISKGKSEVMIGHGQSNLDILILSVGSMSIPSLDAAKQLHEEGLKVAAINLRFLKPLDTNLLNNYVQKSKHVIVVEEGSAIGGTFPYILQTLNYLDKPLNEWHHIAIPDSFVTHGTPERLKAELSLNAEGIVKKALTLCATSIEALI